MRSTLAVFLIFYVCGCAMFKARGVLKSEDVTVTAVGDAGKPGELHTSNGAEKVPIPAGSTITVRKTDAVPATDKTPFQPAVEWTEVKLNGPSYWERTKKDVDASTGTVDTSVALKKVQVAESRPLLYAAIASLLGCGFFLYRAYPTPAFACGCAAIVFFLAWKVSGVPDWMWGVGACGLVAAVGLYLGHERGEKAAVVAGTPVTPVEVKQPTFSPTVTPNAPTPPGAV